MAIYTPRGLKIRIPARWAFGLIGRLWERDRQTDAFRVLKTCEAIESVPATLAYSAGIVAACLYPLSPWAIAPARVSGALLGLCLTQMGLFIILRPTGALGLAYVWSWVNGYGILLVVGIGIAFAQAGWQGAAFWVLGGIVAFLANEAVGFWLTAWNFNRLGEAFTESEVNFFNACRLHADDLDCRVI